MHSFRYVSEVPQPLAGVNVSALLAGGSLDAGHQDGRHPTAGFYSMPRALAHSRIWVVFRPHRAAAATGWLAGAASGPASSIDVPGQRIPHCLSCPAFRSISYSVPSSPKRTVPSAALPSRSSMGSDLYLLSHGGSGSSHWSL